MKKLVTELWVHRGDGSKFLARTVPECNNVDNAIRHLERYLNSRVDSFMIERVEKEVSE